MVSLISVRQNTPENKIKQYSSINLSKVLISNAVNLLLRISRIRNLYLRNKNTT